MEPLSRGGTFVGQHVCTPLRGVAVQVNAFNFPCWGPLEKLAPAFLAGVPSLIKPASPTAFLTAELVELIVDSGLLPEGSVQFVAGSRRRPVRPPHRAGPGVVHRLRVDGADSCAPTPCSSARAVRFTAEADSLNCSILGPDAAPGTPEFDLYVDAARHRDDGEGRAEVHRDPARVRARRSRSTPWSRPCRRGWRRSSSATRPPRACGWARWPSLEQREEVRRSLKALTDAGRVVFGDPEQVEVVDADAERGAFLSPVLLRADRTPPSRTRSRRSARCRR